jgi:hypothetical protein
MSLPEGDGRASRKVFGRVRLAFVVPLAALGLGGLALGVYQTYEHEVFLRGVAEANGRVVEVVAQATGRTDSARVRHLPVVEFTAATGQAVRFTSSFRGDPPFRVGDTVGVLYPPARPSKARAAAAWSDWESKVRNGFLGGGIFFLIASVVTTLIGRAQLRSPRST